MAKLRDALGSAPAPTSIPGLYVRNVPLAVIEQMQDIAEGDAAEVLDFYFEHLLCDAEGDTFEDARTPEQRRAFANTLDARRIVTAVADAMDMGGND